MLSLDTAGLQTGNEIFLAADEDDEHGQQTRHGHGEDVAPLRKLVLAEKAGDGDRQRTLGVIVDNGHRLCEFLPRGEEVEDAYRRDGRTGKRQYDAEEHREYAPAVGIGRQSGAAELRAVSVKTVAREKLLIPAGETPDAPVALAEKIPHSVRARLLIGDVHPAQPPARMLHTAQHDKRKRHIDFKEHCIHVTGQLLRHSNMVLEFETPKTDAGTRDIPMTPEVVHCFRNLIKKRERMTVEPIVGGKAGFLYLDKYKRPVVALHWEHYFRGMISAYNRSHNRKLGILEEKDSEGWKGALLLGAGLLLWEGGKAGIRSIKAHRAKKKAQEVAELKQRSEAAKEAIIQGVQQATAEEMDIVEACVDTEYEEE